MRGSTIRLVRCLCLVALSVIVVGVAVAVTSLLPGWAVLTRIAALLVLVGLVGFVLLRRMPRTQIIRGVAMASGRPGGPAELTIDMMGGEKFATLIVLESPTLRKGQAFDLSSQVVAIGRGADSSVIVPDAQVSRNHAEIRWQGGDLRVLDRGSAYGTFVNDKRVGAEGLPVRDGDTLRLGTLTVMILNIVLPQAAGHEDKTFDVSAGTLASLDGTIPASLLGIDEGGTIPVDRAGVGDRGETIPAQVIIPREMGTNTEQARPPAIEDATGQPGDDQEKSEQLGDDTVRDDTGEEDATLRLSD